MAFNTVPPGDYQAFELLNSVVQQEPATALDPELMGPLAAIGIIKGKPFAPDDRMSKIMTEAAELANATSRSLFMDPRAADWHYYPGSAWMNPLFISGYQFETPIPLITPKGVKPFPTTGYRTLDARSAFFYGITGITPAMSMRPPGIGSQYLFATRDADKKYFDGGKTYKVALPKSIPEANFWSFTLYDNQTRSMLDTPQRYPRAAARAIRRPRRKRSTTAQRPSTSVRPSLRGSSAATGSRPCPAKAGSRSCASTAHSNRSSPRNGGRARSNSSGRLASESGIVKKAFARIPGTIAAYAFRPKTGIDVER
jgi:hypothetical protein